MSRAGDSVQGDETTLRTEAFPYLGAMWLGWLRGAVPFVLSAFFLGLLPIPQLPEEPRLPGQEENAGACPLCAVGMTSSQAALKLLLFLEALRCQQPAHSCSAKLDLVQGTPCLSAQPGVPR